MQRHPHTGDASLYLPVILSSGAAAGTWHVEVNADPKSPPIGSMDFRVDAFVPDRMAVEAGPLPSVLIPGQTNDIPVSARFLYGAPAAGLTGKATLKLVLDPDPFPALTGYHIGLVSETYAPHSRELEMAETDAEGHTTLPVTIDQAPDVTRPVKAADRCRSRRPRRTSVARQRVDPGAAVGTVDRHQALVPGRRGGCADRGGIRHRSGRSGRQPHGDGGKTAPGAGTAGLADGHARLARAIRDGLEG